MADLNALRDKALEVLYEKESDALLWMRTPQPALGNRIPMDFPEDAMTLLLQFEHGIVR